MALVVFQILVVFVIPDTEELPHESLHNSLVWEPWFTFVIICENSPPIFRSMSVIVGLLIGSIVAAATGHFQPWGSQTIADAPAVTFIWVHTFQLKIYGPAVLSMLITFVILFTEALGDIGATCDVSRLAVSGPAFTSQSSRRCACPMHLLVLLAH